MLIFAGLGNPGADYEGTRHNCGFEVIDRVLGSFKRKRKIKLKKSECFFIEKFDSYFLKPLTYMNLSGAALKEFFNNFSIPVKNLTVISDDIDLPLGEIRIRKSGSAGTHNGLKSIIQSLNTPSFMRVRIGVSRPVRMPLEEYVLKPFKKAEVKTVLAVFDAAKDACLDIINKGADYAMNKNNGVSLKV